MSETYYITEGDLKADTAISDNVDSSLILPYIKLAQRFHFDKFLGPALSDELKGMLQTKRIVAAATQANPVVITSDSAHPYITGDSIFIENATGMPGINGTFTVTVLSTTTFELNGLDGTGFPAYVPGSATCIRMPEKHRQLHALIVPALCQYSFYEAIPFQWMKFTNKGMLVKNSENSTPTSSKDFSYFRGLILNTAQQLCLDIENFLCEYQSDFPKWRQDTTDIQPRVGAFRKRVRFG